MRSIATAKAASGHINTATVRLFRDMHHVRPDAVILAVARMRSDRLLFVARPCDVDHGLAVLLSTAYFAVNAGHGYAYPV
jgi:hypothetical protein